MTFPFPLKPWRDPQLSYGNTRSEMFLNLEFHGSEKMFNSRNTLPKNYLELPGNTHKSTNRQPWQEARHLHDYRFFENFTWPTLLQRRQALNKPPKDLKNFFGVPWTLKLFDIFKTHVRLRQETWLFWLEKNYNYYSAFV